MSKLLCAHTILLNFIYSLLQYFIDFYVTLIEDWIVSYVVSSMLYEVNTRGGLGDYEAMRGVSLVLIHVYCVALIVDSPFCFYDW